MASFSGTKRFEIRGVLGEGAMGVVYEAIDRDRQIPVALKRLRSFSPDSLFRFKHEFRALQDLRHPNVVDLGELIEVDGDWFFTMELVEGQDFLSYVRTADGFDESRLRPALAQLANGLHAIHEAGLVHRDLKPSNIRVSDAGRVVILDFGLVAETVSGQDDANSLVGTAAYMAPEQAASKPVSAAADWYSVGVVLYEALTNTLPFNGTSLEILLAKQQSEPAAASTIVDGLPPDLVALCEELLVFDPSARPSGAAILARLGSETSTPMARGSVASNTAPFVGRDHELEALQDAYRRSRDGHAVIVEVRGESGVGKSALIRRFTQRVAGGQDSLVVLRGRCYEREAVPYKAFDGVVDSLVEYMRGLPKTEARQLVPRRAALLPRVFPVLGRVEAIAETRGGDRIGDPLELRARVFAALRELFARLSKRHPLIVIIDDMQWTDADSLLLLADLVRPPEEPGMLVLLSSRETGARSSTLRGDVRQLELEPLELADARHLAQLLLQQSGARESSVAGELAIEAGGHPLFLHELVRHALFAGDDAVRAARLDDAVWARIREQPADVRKILELVSVAGSPLPEETIAVAAEIEPASFSKHVSLLRAAQLIHGAGRAGKQSIEPYHDRIRETVIEHLAPADRLARHQRLALALEVTGMAELRPEVALLHSDAIGDAQRAAHYAALAAARATAGLAFDRAARLWGVALSLVPHERGEEREIQIALGDVLAASGRGRDAAAQYLAGASGADATTRLHCRQRAAAQLLTSGYIEEGLEVIDDLLGELGTSLPATPKRALASLLWCRTKLRLRGLGWKERSAEQVPADELLQIDAYHAVSRGLGIVDTIRGMDFQARGLLLALRSGEPIRVATALLLEAAYRGTAGGKGVDRALELLAEARQISERVDDPYLTAWRTGVDGLVKYFDGQFEPARHLLAESERMLRPIPGAHWELSSARVMQAVNLKQLGALKRIGLLADRYLRDAERRGDLFTGTSLRVLCTWRWLVRDDAAGAKQELDDTAWSPLEGGFHLQHFWKLEAQTEVALYEGAGAQYYDEFQRQLRRYARSLLGRIHAIRCAELSLRGRLALATAGQTDAPERRRRVADKAARKLAGLSGRFPVVMASALRATVAHQRGQRDAALVHLREGEALAEELHQGFWLASLRLRRAAVQGGDEGAAIAAEATRWMESEGVAEPERMVDVLVPGWATGDSTAGDR